jgi:hemerythrin
VANPRFCSGLAQHQEIHKKLTSQVYELRDKFRAGKITVTIETMHFLRNWLSGHRCLSG